MAVLINFKICDNAKECGGIAVCPTGALSWDDKKKIVVIDNSKCASCGNCESACPVEAIHVAKTKTDHKRLKKEIEEDQRKISDLFVDRYGAQPVHPAFNINEDKFDLEVKGSSRITVAEIFNQDSIMCLYKAIPIKELFKDKEIKYKKVNLRTDKLLKEYNIKQLPALLFFKDGKLIGKIEGFFDTSKEAEIKEKIKNILVSK